MSEKFTKEEFNEYMNKITHLKPFNEKEWNEYQYVIKGRVPESPNYQLYLDYIEPERIKRQTIINKKIQYNREMQEKLHRYYRETPKYSIPSSTQKVESNNFKLACCCSLFCVLLILIPFIISIWNFYFKGE